MSNEEKPTSSAEHIVAEAQRRIRERDQQAISPQRQSLVERLNRLILWLSHHWLAVFNVLTGLLVGGSLLAPVLLKLGLHRVGQGLYLFYKPLCHQYPFRSWFLFGPHWARPLDGPISVLKMNQLSSFVGNETVGYKTALCQRDVAIYGALLLGGLAYGLLRDRYRVPALPMWAFFVFGIMPMMLDGGVQWLSYAVWVLFPALLDAPFETIPLMRLLTGALFGLGIAATAYPVINAYFVETRETVTAKLDWT